MANYVTVDDFKAGIIEEIEQGTASEEFVEWVAQAALNSYENYGIDSESLEEEIERMDAKILARKLKTQEIT